MHRSLSRVQRGLYSLRESLCGCHLHMRSLVLLLLAALGLGSLCGNGLRRAFRYTSGSSIKCSTLPPAATMLSPCIYGI